MTKKDFMSKEWWTEVCVRALRTSAETALSMLTVGQAVMEINWINVGSISAVSGIATILMAIAFGLNGRSK